MVAKMGRLAILVIALGLVGCSAGPASSTSLDRTGYQTAVCGAIAGLGDNRSDFQIFVSDASTFEAATAALKLMQDRTQTAVDRLDAAVAWVPGTDVARRLAANQRELLSILGDFDAAIKSDNPDAGWAAARSRYEAWYNGSIPALSTAATELQGLSVSCT